MKKISDEILNKLIDNELNSSEIDELHKLIRENDELLGRTKAHQMVDSVLKNLKIENAPENTTDLIMKKISESIISKERKNGFFKFMMGAFAVSIISVIGFLIFSIPTKKVSPETQLYAIKNNILEFLSGISFPINTELLTIIAASLTVIIFISGYLIFEGHKSFKQKLDSIL
jgi:hypothetical protein